VLDGLLPAIKLALLQGKPLFGPTATFGLLANIGMEKRMEEKRKLVKNQKRKKNK